MTPEEVGTRSGMPGSGSEFAATASEGAPPGDPMPANPGASQDGNLTPDQLVARKGIETKRARAEATGFRLGQTVITNTPKSPRFHNRTGIVVGTSLGEVGVSFTIKELTGKDPVEAWFLPSELTRIRSTGLVSDLRGVRGL